MSLAKDYVKMALTLLSLAPMDYHLQILESFVAISSVSLGPLEEALQNELFSYLCKHFIGKKTAEGDLAAATLLNCFKNSSIRLQKSMAKSVLSKDMNLRFHEQQLVGFLIWYDSTPPAALEKLMKLLHANRFNHRRLIEAFGLSFNDLSQKDLIALCWAIVDPVRLRKSFDLGSSPVQLSIDQGDVILDKAFEHLNGEALHSLLASLGAYPARTIDRFFPRLANSSDIEVAVEELLEIPKTFYQTKLQRLSVVAISKLVIHRLPMKQRLDSLSLFFAKVKSVKIQASFDHTEPLIVESYLELFAGSLEAFLEVEPLYLPFDLMRQIYCWTVLDSGINESGSVVWKLIHLIGKLAPFLIDINGLMSMAPSPVERILILDTITGTAERSKYECVVDEGLQVIPQLRQQSLEILVQHASVTPERKESISNLFFTCLLCKPFSAVQDVIRLFENLFITSSGEAKQVLVSRLSLVSKSNCNPEILLPAISLMIKACSGSNSVFFLESFQSCLVPFLHLENGQQCLMQLASFGDSHFQQALLSTLMQQAVNENLTEATRAQAISSIGFVSSAVDASTTMILGFAISMAKDTRNLLLQQVSMKTAERIIHNKSIHLDERLVEELGSFFWHSFTEGASELYPSLSSVVVAFVDALGISICDGGNPVVTICVALAHEFLKRPPQIAVNALSIVSRFLLLTKSFPPPHLPVIQVIEECLQAEPVIALDCLKWIVEFIPELSQTIVENVDLFSLSKIANQSENVDHLIQVLFQRTTDNIAWIDNFKALNVESDASVLNLFIRNLHHFAVDSSVVEEALRITMTCLSSASEQLAFGFACLYKIVEILDAPRAKQVEPQLLTAFSLGCGSDDPLIRVKCQLLLAESGNKLGLTGHPRVERLLSAIPFVKEDNNGEWPRQVHELANAYTCAILNRIGQSTERSNAILSRTAEYLVQHGQFDANADDHLMVNQDLVIAPKLALKCIDNCEGGSEEGLIVGLSGTDPVNLLALAKCDLSQVHVEDLRGYIESASWGKCPLEMSLLLYALPSDHLDGILELIVRFVKISKTAALKDDAILKSLIKVLMKMEDRFFPLVLDMLADVVSLPDRHLRVRLFIGGLKTVLETGCTSHAYEAYLRFAVTLEAIDLDLCAQAIVVMILLRPDFAVVEESNAITMRHLLGKALLSPTKHIVDAVKMLLTRCTHDKVHALILAPLLRRAGSVIKDAV